ncbi:hypothetical protein ECC01_21495 [Bacillus tequilensis]|nr:hypothetical protein [Bacillus tequilensis]
MIFWILLALAVVAVVWTYIYFAFFDWAGGAGFALLPAFLAALGSGLIGGGLLALSLLIPGEKITQQTFDLRAISTSSTVQGRFFLGSGYVDGKRTLDYIAQEDGWSRVDRGIASASRIFEDTERPTVTEYTHWYSNGWVIPWEVEAGHRWDFHIPSGSILEDYTITNE